jgi:uncharacterized peroxidase-related enzyme
MTWISTVAYADATGRLKALYDRIRSPDGQIDNIMRAHSLRPHTMDGHMALYKQVLHHNANKLPKWLLEAVGLYVSLLNGCDYCAEHHFAGMARLIGDDARAQAIRQAFAADQPSLAFEGRELAAMRYTRKLTMQADQMIEDDIETLRKSGLEDGEILELNQVSAYFAYANRTVLGLGISTRGEVLGLSPGESSDPENWSHG